MYQDILSILLHYLHINSFNYKIDFIMSYYYNYLEQFEANKIFHHNGLITH